PNSRLRLYYAGLPHLAARIEFSLLSYGKDFLRTSHLPPPDSPPRLGATPFPSVTDYVDLGRTFTSLNKCAFGGARVGPTDAGGRRESDRDTAAAKNEAIS